MKFLDVIAAKLAEFAATVVQAAIEEGKDFANEVAKSAQDNFLDLVDRIGDAATKFVTDLMADNTLKGLEKANLAAVQLVEHAAAKGITLAENDASSLIKSAYLAVKAEISKL